MKNCKAIPVTIIAGFLGSGKTSLLRHILNVRHNKRIAVLVNDFGKLNIDAELIVNVEGETVSLTNGCICCTIRDDLLSEVLALANQPEGSRPEHIIIETSGVSDPTLVMHTFTMPAVQNLVEVDAVITMVDADQTLHMDSQWRDLAKRQVQVADLVVINKVDLISEHDLLHVQNEITKLVPQARVLESIHGNIPIELLLNITHQQQPLSDPRHVSDASSSSVFETWIYTSEQSFSLMAIRKLVEDMPIGIYRIKGFLDIESMPNQRAELQMTGGRAWIRLGGSWGDKVSSSTLVLIGQKGEVDEEMIQSQFDQYQARFSKAGIEAAEEPVRVNNLKALTVMFN